MADDLAAIAAGFGAALRAAGLPVGPGRSERFAAAVTLVQPCTASELLNCALATLVSSKDQAAILRAVFAEVFGALPDGAEMTADTVFWIATMTKAITSAAAMQLVEQGKLTLDGPIAGVLPELALPQVLEGFDPAGEPRLRPARRPIRPGTAGRPSGPAGPPSSSRWTGRRSGCAGT